MARPFYAFTSDCITSIEISELSYVPSWELVINLNNETAEDLHSFSKEHIGVAGGHSNMGRKRLHIGLGLLICRADHLGDVAEPRCERLRIKQPDRDRVDVEDMVDVVAEGFVQLVGHAVAGAMADQGLEPQARESPTGSRV